MRMSRMGCPATGRMSHRFDKETHRCACGRWQAGFKPKSEPKNPRAECQICERQQAVMGGALAHHGYKRPGWGCIVGDCMGSGFAPFPAFDRLERYLEVVRAHIVSRQEWLAKAPAIEELVYTYTIGYDSVWSGKKAERRTVTVKKGDVEKRWIEGSHFLEIPSFDELLQRSIRDVQADVRNAQADEIRVVARIEKAKAAVAV